MFKFIMSDKDQKKHTILYDQHTSKMTWEETGNLVVTPKEELDKLEWSVAQQVSKENPGKKISAQIGRAHV